MKKPNLLLLDSDVIIQCYALGTWEAVKQKYTVYVTSIISSEVTYAFTPTGKISVDLQSQAKNREVQILEAEASEMFGVTQLFVPSFAQGINDGELEALAVLARGDISGCLFCSGDTNGLEAAGMLSVPVISLEELATLAGIKIQSPLRLQANFTTRSVRLHHEKGAQRRITNEYFRKPPLM